MSGNRQIVRTTLPGRLWHCGKCYHANRKDARECVADRRTYKAGIMGALMRIDQNRRAA